jgi:hypothetical protein
VIALSHLIKPIRHHNGTYSKQCHSRRSRGRHAASIPDGRKASRGGSVLDVREVLYRFQAGLATAHILGHGGQEVAW